MLVHGPAPTIQGVARWYAQGRIPPERLAHVGRALDLDGLGLLPLASFDLPDPWLQAIEGWAKLARLVGGAAVLHQAIERTEASGGGLPVFLAELLAAIGTPAAQAEAIRALLASVIQERL